jgi:hypothetical protein
MWNSSTVFDYFRYGKIHSYIELKRKLNKRNVKLNVIIVILKSLILKFVSLTFLISYPGVNTSEVPAKLIYLLGTCDCF